MKINRKGDCPGRRTTAFLLCIFLLSGLAIISKEVGWAGESPNLDLSNYVEADDWLDMGGQIRFRGEYRYNYDLEAHHRRALPDNDEFMLGRFRLWSKMAPSPSLLAFVELQSAWVWESRYIDTDLPSVGGGNIYQDRLDIQQAYLDIYPSKDFMPLYLRLGRQELNYGQQRLIGPFDWANVGRSFESARLRYDDDTWWVDSYIAQVVVHDDNRLNDTSNRLPNSADDSTFYSVYGGFRGWNPVDLELYWILRDNENAGNREVHTVGTRFEGECGQWDYDGEFAYQFGDWTGDIDHKAFALHIGGGYRFPLCPAKPRLGIQYNFASGDDDPEDDNHETFDNLFPTNHPHYGYIDFFSWQNMHNLAFEIKCDPFSRLWIKTHFHLFWLHEVEDQWYNAAGGATAGIGPSAGRDADSFVGEELDIVINYVPDLPFVGRALSLQFGYCHFWSEDFLKDAIGVNDGADFAYLQTLLAF